MDLAKIRQKARLEQENLQTDEISLLKMEFPNSIPVNDDDNNQLCAVEEELFRGTSTSNEAIHISPVQAGHPATPTYHSQIRDPLAVILAGREAAGCDEDLPLVSVEQPGLAVSEHQEYLCFRVSDEVYGINIMDIKEIIKPREVTEVPRAPSFVSGIISLRGIIIPIIDMLDRLGLTRETVTGRERVIVVRNGETFCGLLVDEIFQVVHIAADCFEAAPAVLEGIDRDFVIGIGRADGRMIILLNLENVADIHLY